MHYGNDDHRRVLYSKINTEWKAANDRAPRVSMHIRIYERSLRDALQYRQNFVEEFVP